MKKKKITILIDDHKVISWNKLYSCRHWTYRKQMADNIHQLVKHSIVDPFITVDKFPVDITIKAYQRRLIDSDNISSKLYIDGLKLIGILPEDDPKYVRKVITQSIKSDRDYLVLEILLAH